jgi:hypothetical protein
MEGLAVLNSYVYAVNIMSSTYDHRTLRIRIHVRPAICRLAKNRLFTLLFVYGFQIRCSQPCQSISQLCRICTLILLTGNWEQSMRPSSMSLEMLRFDSLIIGVAPCA